MRLIAVAAATLACVALLPAGAGAASAPLAVTGYQSEGAALTRIDDSAAALTTVGVDGVTVTSSGAGVHTPAADAARQLARVHHDGLRGELLMSNYSDAIGDFSEDVAHRLLSSRAHIAATTDELSSDVRNRGWDGICVDLESLRPRDADGLLRFVRSLRASLPAGASLSIAVQAATSPGDYADLGYRLHALAGSVDRVALMTYDQHGPWENRPGPVGALDWTRRALVAAEKFVPADRIDLGVAEYGYAWRPHENVQLSDARARSLAGKHARFDRARGEWTATLSDGSTLWWSDARSYRLRADFARAQGLDGLAVWSLGLGDPLR